MEGQHLPYPSSWRGKRVGEVHGEAAASLCVSEDPTSSGVLGNNHTHGGSPATHIRSARTLPSAQGGMTGPPLAYLLLLPVGGRNAEQEARDEPSKHKLISSLVTRVTRVGHHPLLMLGGAHTRHAAGTAGSW